MAKSPIITTLDTLMADLKDTTDLLREKEKHAAGLTAAIKSLIGVCEDDETKSAYLLALEEISGKPGFMDAVRSVLTEHSKHLLTPVNIKEWIVMGRKMDLSGYSNAMASIHTTLRRMKDKNEVEEIANDKGERAYRLIVKAPIPPASMRRESWRSKKD